jgi:hypothetical protein
VAAVLIATGGTKSFCVFQVAIEPINRAATRSSTGIGAVPIAGSDAIVFGSLISRVSGESEANTATAHTKMNGKRLIFTSV